jgi:5-methylthioadenosine/S-adenosylhomocysteine deaminase
MGAPKPNPTLLAMFILILTPFSGIVLADGNEELYISEILVSPNNENYGGTDWNCDGTFGSNSDQFIELFNPTSNSIDISGWTLEAEGIESTDSFSIPSNTMIQSGHRAVFFRADTGIALDFFTGNIVRLMDPSNALISSLTFDGNDSDWDTSYVSDSSGGVSKVSPPTPGWGPGEATPSTGPGATCPEPTGVSHSGSYVLTGTVVTMESESSVLLNGNVLVENGVISAVWSEGQTTPTAAIGVEVIETGGVIYPGLIDVHNHPHYNAIPIWDHGTDGWDNRYQWRTETAYKNAITKVENGLNDGGSDGCSLMAESMKHAEVKSIVGGTTVIQGATNEYESTFESILARNLEKTNFGEDQIETRVGGSWFPTDYSGSHIKSKKAAGTLDAWMIHLSEGIDEPSRAEFDSLVNNQLVIDELVVIHGTALTSTEFGLMGQAGASLVWSPMSNLLLYGDTADIVSADQAGVSISISPDWAPSGAKNVLHEVKIADWWDSNVLGDRFTDFQMVQMITTNSIDQVGWTEKVGRIKPGLAADFLVLDSFNSNPYRNLIEAVDPDVRLVVVDGFALFGDVDLMEKMSNDTEIINSPDFQKGIDIRFEGVPSGTQTYATVEQKLKDCLKDLSIGERPFDPWYTFGDDRYFDVLNRSLTFQKDRTVDLWSEYYDIDLDSFGNRTSVNSSDPSTWTGGGNGGSSNTNDSTNIQDDENNSISLDDLPLVMPTFGPFGGEQYPSNSSFNQGIHIEECQTNPPDPLDDGRVRGCGSLLVLLSEGEGCFVEYWPDDISSNSWIVFESDCPDDSSWTQVHQGVSESSADGVWPVSRLDPSYVPGDSITFPGMSCDDPVVKQALVVGENPAIRGDDERIGEWVCRDAFNWMMPIQIIDNTPDSQNEEISALTEEIWYWTAIIVTLSVLIGSIVVISFTISSRKSSQKAASIIVEDSIWDEESTQSNFDENTEEE